MSADQEGEDEESEDEEGEGGWVVGEEKHIHKAWHCLGSLKFLHSKKN